MLKKIILALAATTLTASLCAKQTFPDYKDNEKVLFRSPDWSGPDKFGVRQYRIPALTKNPDGTLVANTVCRLSHEGDHGNSTTFFAVSKDNGKTWETIRHNTDFENVDKRPEGSFPLTERTQESQVVWNPKLNMYICTYLTQNTAWFTTSKDLKVWTKPTPAVKGQEFVNCWPSPASLTMENNGDMLFAITGHRDKKRFAALAWTKDTKTFEVSSKMPCEGNETAVVPLGKGRYFVSTRIRPHRLNMIYNRNTKTWTKPWPMKAPFWRCEVDVINDNGILYMSTPADKKHRRNGTIFKSTDEGRTWTVAAKVCNDYFAYSSLVKMDNGKIGLLAERAWIYKETLTDIVFHEIDLKK